METINALDMREPDYSFIECIEVLLGDAVIAKIDGNQISDIKMNGSFVSINMTYFNGYAETLAGLSDIKDVCKIRMIRSSMAYKGTIIEADAKYASAVFNLNSIRLVFYTSDPIKFYE